MANALGEIVPKLAGHRIRAIAVDGTSGTIVPIDKVGRPVGLASMYNDLAERSDVDRIAAIAPDDTAARGGTSPLARALPMRALPGLSRIIHQADWIAGRFSGRFDVTDENNALKSGYDPIHRHWPSWIARTGIDPKLFPTVVPAGTRAGTITAEAAARFGLPQDVAIIAGTTDGCAAFLASGAGRPGRWRDLARHHAHAQIACRRSLSLRRLTAFTAIASAMTGLPAAPPIPAAGRSRHYFSKADIERLSPLLDPDHADRARLLPFGEARRALSHRRSESHAPP